MFQIALAENEMPWPYAHDSHGATGSGRLRSSAERVPPPSRRGESRTRA
jgi:hypothetical protein